MWWRRPKPSTIDVLVDDSFTTLSPGGRVEVLISNDSGATVTCAVHVLAVRGEDVDLAVTFQPGEEASKP